MCTCGGRGGGGGGGATEWSGRGGGGQEGVCAGRGRGGTSAMRGKAHAMYATVHTAPMLQRRSKGHIQGQPMACRAAGSGGYQPLPCRAVGSAARRRPVPSTEGAAQWACLCCKHTSSKPPPPESSSGAPRRAGPCATHPPEATVDCTREVRYAPLGDGQDVDLVVPQPKDAGLLRHLPAQVLEDLRLREQVPAACRFEWRGAPWQEGKGGQEGGEGVWLPWGGLVAASTCHRNGVHNRGQLFTVRAHTHKRTHACTHAHARTAAHVHVHTPMDAPTHIKRTHPHTNAPPPRPDGWWRCTSALQGHATVTVCGQ